MAIWKQPVTIGTVKDNAELLSLGQTTGSYLGLRVVEVGEDFLSATMPVDQRTKQSYGRLHGGASCVMAEEIGSIGGYLCVDPEHFFVVGIEINANHVRPVRDGHIVGTARPLHLGQATHIWEIRIEDEQQRLVCISRLTLAVVPLRADKVR
ncbi:MAG: hotdog fold thioesterase [Nevskia sp.]|nr:hotdog fold thioesterase [Nevskia sp.]